MVTIVRKEVTETLPGMGEVHFEPLERAGDYWREHSGYTHTQRFRFNVNGRDYWGEINRIFDKRKTPGRMRTWYDIEIRTNGRHASRAINLNHKLAWRVELRAAFRRYLEQFINEQEASA